MNKNNNICTVSSLRSHNHQMRFSSIDDPFLGFIACKTNIATFLKDKLAHKVGTTHPSGFLGVTNTLDQYSNTKWQGSPFLLSNTEAS